MADTFRDLQSFFRTTLSQSAGASDLTIVVATAPAVNTCYLVIEPNTNNEEIVLMTLKSGTTLTVTRGLATSGSDESAGTGKAHPAGAQVIIADAHYYLKRIQISKAFEFRGSYASLTAIQAIAGPALGDMAIDTSTGFVYWYNGSVWAVIGGGSAPSDASTTVKGVAKLSVAPASPTNPIATGDNDPRVPTQGENDALAGTAGTPSAANKYITNDDSGETGAGKVARIKSSGKLDPTIMPVGLTVDKSYTAGEAIDASVTPQAVYIKAADEKIYKAIANADSEVVHGFIGFVAGGQNVALDAAVIVTHQGVIGGFTALTIGARYYISTTTAGAITATAPSDRALPIGIAMSATTLLIFDGNLKVKKGTYSITKSQTDGGGTFDAAQIVGFRPRIVILMVSGTGSGGTTNRKGRGTLFYSNVNFGFGFSNLSAGAALTTDNMDSIGSVTASVDTFIDGTLNVNALDTNNFVIRTVWNITAGSGRSVTFNVDWIAIG